MVSGPRGSSSSWQANQHDVTHPDPYCRRRRSNICPNSHLNSTVISCPLDLVPLEAALASARRAVAADERDAFGHFSLGCAHCLRRETAAAEAASQTALNINPSFAQAHFALGFNLVSSRRPVEAIPYFRKFMALSPWDPHRWTSHHMRAMAHYWLGDLAAAEDYARRSTGQPNVTRWPFATLVSVLGAAGRSDALPVALERLLEHKPDYSVAVARDNFFFLDDPENLGRYLAGLRAAGVRDD